MAVKIPDWHFGIFWHFLLTWQSIFKPLIIHAVKSARRCNVSNTMQWDSKFRDLKNNSVVIFALWTVIFIQPYRRLPISVNWTFFSLGHTAEALRAIIGSKSAISFQRGPVDPKFQVEGVAPTNHSPSQNTRINVLSYDITSNSAIAERPRCRVG